MEKDNKTLEDKADKDYIKAFLKQERVRFLTQEEYARQIRHLLTGIFGDFQEITSDSLRVSKDNFDISTISWRNCNSLPYQRSRWRLFSIAIFPTDRIRVSEDTEILQGKINQRMVNFNSANSKPEENTLIHTERLIHELQKRLIEKRAKDASTDVNIAVFMETCSKYPESMEDAMIKAEFIRQKKGLPKIIDVLHEKGLLNQKWWAKLQAKEIHLTNGFTLRNPQFGSAIIDWELIYNNKKQKTSVFK